MKKICYIATIQGTISAFFVPQLNYLANNGFEVSVMCSNADELKAILDEKVKCIPCEIRRGIYVRNLYDTIRSMVKTFKREKFDIVQYCTPNAAFCAAVAAKLSGIKIRNYHLMGLRYLGEKGLSRAILKTIEKITCLLSTDIECVSQSNMELAINEGLFKRKTACVVWNGSSGGVDLKKFDAKCREEYREEIRRKISLKSDDFVFGFFGRITKDKGIDEILKAYQNIGKDCKLLIIGDHEGIETLDKELWEYAQNNDNIFISDNVCDVEKYYCAIDVLLLPSYREGFGMVIAEAAAMGTPAIVSKIPGPIDVIQEAKTAITVKVKDWEDLRTKMLEAMDNSWIDDAKIRCVNHISEKFDSNKLNREVLVRKEYLANR